MVEDGHMDFFDTKKKKKDAGRAKNRFAGLLEKNVKKEEESGSDAEEVKAEAKNEDSKIEK